jgi:hypothetical protein
MVSPVASVRATGWRLGGSGWALASSSTSGSDWMVRPMTCPSGPSVPKMRLAAGFIDSIRPSGSITTTPSSNWETTVVK